jgi:hypothetical protein
MAWPSRHHCRRKYVPLALYGYRSPSRQKRHHANPRSGVIYTTKYSTAGAFSLVAWSNHATTKKDQEAAKRGGVATWTGGGGRAPPLSFIRRGLAATVFAAFVIQPSFTINSLAALVVACAVRSWADITYVGLTCAANFFGITASSGSTLCGGHASRSALAVAFAVTFAVAFALAFALAFASASTAAFISILAYASACSKHHPTRTSDVHLFSVSLLYSNMSSLPSK